METSKVALVLSLLVCSGWTVLGSSAIDEDAVPPVPLDGTSMHFIDCDDCKKTVKLLEENYASATKQEIKDALKEGKLSKKAGECSSACYTFVDHHMDDIVKRLKGKSLGSICKDTNACPPQ